MAAEPKVNNDKVIALKAAGASCGSCRYHATAGNGVNSYEICIIKENKRISHYNICCHHKSSMNK